MTRSWVRILLNYKKRFTVKRSDILLITYSNHHKNMLIIELILSQLFTCYRDLDNFNILNALIAGFPGRPRTEMRSSQKTTKLTSHICSKFSPVSFFFKNSKWIIMKINAERRALKCPWGIIHKSSHHWRHWADGRKSSCLCLSKINHGGFSVRHILHTVTSRAQRSRGYIVPDLIFKFIYHSLLLNSLLVKHYSKNEGRIRTFNSFLGQSKHFQRKSLIKRYKLKLPDLFCLLK